VVLMASGSEVSLCMAAVEPLAAQGIRPRVVSMPSWELFEQQSQQYRESVLPPSVTARVAVEQASTLGWTRYAGETGALLGMTTFGMSAPLAVLQREFGFTTEHVVAMARDQVERRSKN
jgi:transketolase